MSVSNCETTLVSLLLESITDHLQLVHRPMDEGAEHSTDNDELWLSGHRSIFSSYGSHCRKNVSPLRSSQYDGFHWDFYENSNYHQLAFEHDQESISQTASLSEWSMRLNSDNTENDADEAATTSLSSSSKLPRTSWHAIKTGSINQSRSSSSSSSSTTTTSGSASFSSNPLTLYHLFQRTKSQQHPCRLYQNFSDKSTCDSLTSSSCSNVLTGKLSNTTRFSRLKSANLESSSSRSHVDQCLQTSLILSPTADTKNTACLLRIPSQLSSTSRHSLPDLDFLTYYAKENPPPLPILLNQTKPCPTSMKSTLSEPLSLTKRATRTIFFCSVHLPDRPLTLRPPLSIIQESKSIKISSDGTEAYSSPCSSTSSSGYFSNTSTNQVRHIPKSYPLKSCLKRTKNEQLNSQIVHNEIDISKHRRYSSPTTSSLQSNISLKFPTKNASCTLSEYDLRAKKSVSFCDEIARRLIAPSMSSKQRYQESYDSIPRESLIDSPPNEFNLSDIDDGEEEGIGSQVINFIENTPDDITKSSSIKYQSDGYLIDVFANTILHVLEIKCSDPKSYYLNNQTNSKLDRILRQDFCPLLREILEDGLRQHSGSLFSKKIHLWRLVELTTPSLGRFHEAKTKAHIGLSSTTDWTEKFNSFIYHLLNLHELASWLTHFISHRTLFSTYYESWAFVLVNNDGLLESITNQLEKLSPLPFRLKYSLLSNSKLSLVSQRSSSSILSRKFHVRSWLRDRKAQVKISPRDSQIPLTKSITSVPPNISLRRKKFNSIPVSK